MSNPYDKAFGDSESKGAAKDIEAGKQYSFVPESLEEGPEPLDELVDACSHFKTEAAALAKLLTATRAVDHKPSGKAWMRFFVEMAEQQAKGSLISERAYYEELQQKILALIHPMRALAQQHLTIVKQYHDDIDEHYFSAHKTALEVKRTTEEVAADILLQRRILNDAARDLSVLESALEAAEIRLKSFIRAGGDDNLSEAEWRLLVRDRRKLTTGETLQFNYEFFKLNLLDQAALAIGVVQKQTTSQYLQQLSLALENRSA